MSEKLIKHLEEKQIKAKGIIKKEIDEIDDFIPKYKIKEYYDASEDLIFAYKDKIKKPKEEENEDEKF